MTDTNLDINTKVEQSIKIYLFIKIHAETTTAMPVLIFGSECREQY